MRQFLANKNPMQTTIVFGLLSIFKVTISFVLLPFYLNYLSPEDYGMIAMLTIYSGFVTTIGSFGLKSALYTFYFDFDDKAQLRVYLQNLFSAHVYSFLGLLGIHLLFGEFIFDWVFDSSKIQFYHLGLIALLSSIFSVFSSLYFVYLKNEIRIKAFVKYTISFVFFLVLSQVLFVIVYNFGVFGFLLGALIANGLVFLMVLFYNPDLFGFKFSRSILKPSFQYSIKLLPFLIFLALENQIDRFFIEHNLGLRQAGLYALLVKLFALLTLALNALDDGLRPFLFKDLKNNPEKTTNYYTLYSTLGVVILLAVLMLGYNLEYFINNQDYMEVKQYMFVASLAFLTIIPIRFAALLLIYHKASSALSYWTFLKTGVLILLLLVLIPEYGLNGALYSVCISGVLNFVFYFLWLVRVKRFKIALRPHFPLFAFLVYSVLLWSLETTSLKTEIQWIGFLVILGFACYWMRIDYKNIMKVKDGN